MTYMRRPTRPAAAFDAPDRRMIMPPNAPRAVRHAIALGGRGIVNASAPRQALGSVHAALALAKVTRLAAPLAEVERRAAPLTLQHYYGGQIKQLQKYPGRTQTTPAAPLQSSMPGFDSSSTPSPTGTYGRNPNTLNCSISRMGCSTPSPTKPLPLPPMPSPDPGPNLQIGTGIGTQSIVVASSSPISPPAYLTGPVFTDPAMDASLPPATTASAANSAGALVDDAVAWARANPLLAAGGAIGVFLLLFRK